MAMTAADLPFFSASVEHNALRFLVRKLAHQLFHRTLIAPYHHAGLLQVLELSLARRAVGKNNDDDRPFEVIFTGW